MRAARTAWAFVSIALLGCATPAPQSAQETEGRSVGLVNPGFESVPLTLAGHPQGWVPIQHASVDSYAFALDDAVHRSGAKSVRITNIVPEAYGSIIQKVTDSAVRGRTVRFSGWLRTQDVTGNGFGGGAVLLVQAMRSGSPIAHDHMRAGAVKGTTDWQRHAVTLAVPADADNVEIGAMLFGGGTLWFDDARLEIVAPVR